MDEIEKEKNKIKAEAKKLKQEKNKNIKKEIQQNYEIGIEYYEDVEKLWIKKQLAILCKQCYNINMFKDKFLRYIKYERGKQLWKRTASVIVFAC